MKSLKLFFLTTFITCPLSAYVFTVQNDTQYKIKVKINTSINKIFIEKEILPDRIERFDFSSFHRKVCFERADFWWFDIFNKQWRLIAPSGVPTKFDILSSASAPYPGCGNADFLITQYEGKNTIPVVKLKLKK